MVPSQQQRRVLPVAAIFGSATEKSLIQKQHIMKDAQQPRNLLIVEEAMLDAVIGAAEAVLVAEAVLLAEAEAVLLAEELFDDEIPKH